MIILSFLVSALIVYAIGRLLVARLGWPTTLAGAGRWGIVLLAFAALFSALPELFQRVGAELGPVPTVSLQDLVPGLCVIALGVLGYVAWTRDAVTRELAADEAERARRLPRRRVLPPPPPAGVEPRADGGFRLLEHEDEHDAPAREHE